MSDMLSAPARSASAGSTPNTTLTIEEEGTGPYHYVTVTVPDGIHPATLAAALRTLPIACILASMMDGKLSFKVIGHDDEDADLSAVGAALGAFTGE
ncbi:hypothetical protein E0504_39065 [Parafrankia sp. BMG5.11]|nr:hypothetical protein E0504_39065 [Parafrankia sp. BMG5.11]SQD99411.1 conserved hypothetical protein [Parafrankia sp. Ea1.12]